MSNPNQLAFNCLNQECGKLIRLSRPEKSGIYSVTCPNCGTTKKIRLKGIEDVGDVPDMSRHNQGKEDTSSKPIDNSSNQIIELEDDCIVGTPFKILCPHCKKQEFCLLTDKAGHQTVSCPSCKGKMGVSVRGKTEIVLVTEPLQTYKGKLTILRRGWINKDYPLREGKNIIGRYDELENSDIAVRNDPSMSRRSVEIEVKHVERGYTFKLTVLKATNPVLHNNSPLTNGESVSLNFGDSIIMGKTRFRFDKDKR